MTCDYCPAELPEGYVMKVDYRGRPVEAICPLCEDVQLVERAKRLGIPAPDLTDLFALHLDRLGLLPKAP